MGYPEYVHPPWFVGVTRDRSGHRAYTVMEHTETLVGFDPELCAPGGEIGPEGYCIDRRYADILDYSVATARLIAGAPGMREACQDIVSAVDSTIDLRNFTPWFARLKRAADAARAALAATEAPT